MNLPERAPFRPCNVQPRPRLSLRPSRSFDLRVRRIILEVTTGLPALAGGPICIYALPHLKAHRGELISGCHKPGTPVHAASFIKLRKIVLETQLLARPQKLRLILAHEIFHFVWARLGNRKRAEYATIVATELERRARGELGESANVWKHTVPGGRDMKTYVCESFCDTAAWLYSGVKQSREVTLAPHWKARRRLWFESLFAISGKSNSC